MQMTGWLAGVERVEEQEEDLLSCSAGMETSGGGDPAGEKQITIFKNEFFLPVDKP